MPGITAFATSSAYVTVRKPRNRTERRHALREAARKGAIADVIPLLESPLAEQVDLDRELAMLASDMEAWADDSLGASAELWMED